MIIFPPSSMILKFTGVVVGVEIYKYCCPGITVDEPANGGIPVY